MPLLDTRIEDILCLQEERTVGRDNCVKYQRKVLQIPADQYRCHYVKPKVRVHGPRKLATYDGDVQIIKMEAKPAQLR